MMGPEDTGGGGGRQHIRRPVPMAGWLPARTGCRRPQHGAPIMVLRLPGRPPRSAVLGHVERSRPTRNVQAAWSTRVTILGDNPWCPVRADQGPTPAERRPTTGKGSVEQWCARSSALTPSVAGGTGLADSPCPAGAFFL